MGREIVIMPGDNIDMQIDINEFYNERAAIMEHDGGLPRKLAELEAYKATVANFGTILEVTRLITTGGSKI